MICLGMDTSTMRTSVGIIKDDEELLSYEISGSMYHSEELTNIIEESLNKLNLKIKDIDLFSVGVGPGSFTGVRIAVTIARIFASSTQKNIISVSSLMATALSYEGNEIIVPIVDARRNRAYFGLYTNNNQEISCIKEDSLMDIDEIIKLVENKKVALVGSGATTFKDKFMEKCEVIVPKFNLIRGANIAKLGKINFEKYGADKIEDVLPNYINIPQALENIKK